ncbi:MAG TPA: alpha-galactosidase [Blastocatellia bacterium]|nr:alpha-galactosidase [Blastocatellia bacterium]
MTNRSTYTNHAKSLVLALVWLLMLALQSSAQELSNDRLTLRLGVTPEGIPIIKEAVWQATGQFAFRDLGTPDGLNDWVPAALIPTTATTPSAWEVSEADDWTTAEASRDLANNLRLTWIVELPKQGQLFRLRMRLTNNSKKARAVEWFPTWAASWDVGGQAQWARWWQALTYESTEQPLSNTRTFHLGSRLHSSDDAGGGVNPYWIVGGDASRIYFGLQWSGGWSTVLRGGDNGFTYSVGLPPEETQLVLNRREAIEGPTLLVMPVTSADEAGARAVWLRERYDLGRVLYGGPRASFPLTYNTWYAVGEAVDDDFLNRQVAAMSPYAFDAFVVDAGWFSDGRWKANKKKFPGNDLADILAALKADGIKAGLWSTPQYVSPASNSAGLAVEDPPVTMQFFNGALADLSSGSFGDYLSNHVQALRANYSMDYWKYDQAFFTETSGAGEMKNVIGLQNALQAVRQDNPDLTIENCQSGGRMINDFTLLATQTSWLRDSKVSGLDGARSNISVALGALDFVFPWAALRFTNNFDEIDASNDEMTRLYCRSAMIGRWGISSDLSLIGEPQQRVILKEAENYRRLSPIKYACTYDLRLPGDAADVAGVTFYSGRRARAGVLLYRWQRDGAFDQHIALTKLKPELTYHVVDADTGAEVTASGSELMANGINVSFSSGRLSALLFIDSVTATPAQ